jgi:hypothetical protein
MTRQPIAIPLTLDLPIDLADLVVAWSQAAGLTPGQLAVGVLRLGIDRLEHLAGCIDVDRLVARDEPLRVARIALARQRKEVAS